MEKYRFLNGSLYEYCKISNSYIHVYKHYKAQTKRQAIKQYEALE